MTRFFVALSLVLALTASAMPAKREGVNGDLKLASQASHAAAHILDSAGSSLDHMNPGKFEADPEDSSPQASSSQGSYPEASSSQGSYPEASSSQGSYPEASSSEVPSSQGYSPSTVTSPPLEDPVDEFPMASPSEVASEISSSVATPATPSQSAPAQGAAPKGDDQLMGMVNKLPVIGPLVGGLAGGGGGGLPVGLL